MSTRRLIESAMFALVLKPETRLFVGSGDMLPITRAAYFERLATLHVDPSCGAARKVYNTSPLLLVAVCTGSLVNATFMPFTNPISYRNVENHSARGRPMLSADIAYRAERSFRTNKQLHSRAVLPEIKDCLASPLMQDPTIVHYPSNGPVFTK